MSGRIPFAALGTFALLSCAEPAATQEAEPPVDGAWSEVCEDWDEWDKPAPPFRVHGNTYYVGTCGISAILITDPEGHILLDSGTQDGADVVAANIAALGFDIGDVTIIGFSHEHFDHVGGIAKLIDLSGAMLVSSEAAAPVLRSGVVSDNDPQAGMHEPFAPAPVEFVQGSGEGMGAGDNFLVSIATPGHTPGAMSWYWESCEGEQCLTIVYADSMSPVSADDYRFSDHPDYVKAYRESIARVAALDCDILLTPHPSASGMRDKLIAGDLTGGMDCAQYAAAVERRLDRRLAEEASGK